MCTLVISVLTGETYTTHSRIRGDYATLLSLQTKIELALGRTVDVQLWTNLV